jgi:hypothetical protein
MWVMFRRYPAMMRAELPLIVTFVVTLAGCVMPSTRRTHDENMAKADAFRRTFDNEVKRGTSFDDVLAYLKAHNLHFGSSGLTDPHDEPPERDGTGRLEVEVFREKSPNWACGKGSVGLSLYFVNGNLNRTGPVTYWSFDCP